MKTNEYFDLMSKEVDRAYEVATLARSKGLDPVMDVEIPKANSLAERVVGLISAVYPQVNDKKIVNRILDLEREFSSLDPAVALSIAEEVAKEKFCKFKDHHEAVEAGIRMAIAYLTLGVVSSPIEGFTEIKIKKTRTGEDYFAPFYSGPIRSAGGTEAGFSLVIVDHLREVFGYTRYDPTEEEVKRGVHESYEYHERVTNLQYLPSEQEIDYLMRHLPVQLSGDASEDKEVYNYKDLSRIETNFIRGGFALVMCEGFAQKAPKILGRVDKLKKKGFKLSGWDWLPDFVALQKKIKEGKAAGGSRGGATYIQDLVAGRPVFAHPHRSGGFRIRYGRSRNTGYSTLALNPATMAVTGKFIALGTQLKIEKPTKGCTVAVCDSIDGPIVKTTDGSVKYLHSYEEGLKISNDIQEIIYLGDLLVPFGDFLNRNHPLTKPGYIKQYWEQEARALGINDKDVSLERAVELSKDKGIALHPNYIFYWSQISVDDLVALLDWITHSRYENKLVLPYSKIEREKFAKGKRALELIGCEHDVFIENVIVSEDKSKALLFNLGIDIAFDLSKQIQENLKKLDSTKNSLDNVNLMCPVKIRDKAGAFAGARMGRPEKAKLRKLTGSPHVLFPVGNEGGRMRSFQAANSVGYVNAEFPAYYCNKCKEDKIYPKCESCGEQCKKVFYCSECDRNYDSACTLHARSQEYKKAKIDVRKYFDEAKRLTGIRIEELPVAVKGVRGTSSHDHSCEHLGKGLLRAKYDLHVNKDGTIRYDMSEMPLTHFKPKEVGTDVGTLKKLGYEFDVNGDVLENEDQVLEIFPHDIVLPACPESPDEMADDVFYNISCFVDDELEKIYGLPRYFNYKSKQDIRGALVGCIAPHNCAAVTGRIIGFSKAQALLASPFIHAAMRRDCDGDEAAVMLLMDMLINFSKKFLPSHRGGTQDSPLVLNTRLRAGEVDDMIFDLDVTKEIPLYMYESAEKEEMPSNVKMERVKDRLGTEHEFDQLNFSYDTSDINLAPMCSSYKILPKMQDKVGSQMNICKKIRAVDTSDVARLTIERHFIRDIKGNLRKFSMQSFRCVNCNEKYRRVPLSGKCTKCGGKLLFTISEGSIIKYLESALDLARTYNVSSYLLESIEIVARDIEGIFGKEKEKQEALKKWF